jgi:amino acid adenylation domain-containing protein
MSEPSDHHPEHPSQDKRALLAQLLQRASAASPTLQPLSYGQQALWFTHQLAPQSWAYHMVFSARLRSEVDVSAAQQAFQILLRRHAVLRTTYPFRQGRPSQSIAPDAPVHFESESLEAASWAACQDRLLAEIRRPFDLERGPVLRVRLFSRSARDHLLLLVVHHIAIDFWSLGVLLSEFRELYPAVRDAKSMPLAPLQVQYTDYIRWQTTLLAGVEGERLWTYWRQQLAGEWPVLNLPLDRPRPPVQTYHGASHPFKLSASCSRHLQKLGQHEGVTPYMILLAALQILLHRYTGQEDIWVGSPMAGRHQPQFRQIVGYCVNPVVLRGDLSGNPTLRTVLGQVRHTVLDALRHADYPFPLLVERLQPKRDASHSPLFQVSLALQTLGQQEDLLACFMPARPPSHAIAFGDLVLEPYPLPQQEGQFELSLEMAEVDDVLCGMWQYNADLFDASTMARMAQHFAIVLDEMVAHLEQPIATLPLLTPAERQQLLVAWNITQTPASPDQCVHQLFEAQVERTPHAIAVVFEDDKLTYRALNQRANQLAHHLQTLGVGPETLVGLCVERSLELVVGILGILKAGGAYVPLDPTYPRERLAFLAADTGLRVLLTQAHLQSSLPVTPGVNCLYLDKDWHAIARHSTANPARRAVPSNLVYVIYTSGSTGTPKGVMVTHANVTRLFAATQDGYHFSERDVWTLFHSVAFDFSVWELWGALLYGGRLIVVPYLVSRSPDAFYQLVCAHQVTVLNQTPSAFRQFMRAEESAGHAHPLALQWVIFGGEALELASLRPWFERHGDRVPRLVNMYGITETTVHVTYRPLTRADLDRPSSVIGGPIPDLQLYILDAQLQPLPMAVSGEMYVGGAGVSRGYWKQPELTAARFLDSPFAAGRLYKTGDLARYLPTGDIEYLGRIDQQVKIRGFRIELGEIETALAQHPRVREGVVLAREDEPGPPRLVAYWTPRAAPAPSGHELRRWLQDKLPEYMLPAAFVQLETLPLTVNGKVNRRALPVPVQGRPEVDTTWVAPRNPVEHVLAGIWAEVLGIGRIGIHDHFFELGGHSLQAMQLISQAAAALRLDIPVHLLFLNPTIATLAQALQHLPSHPLPEPRQPTHSQRPPLTPTSPFTTFERRPLLPLFDTGELAPVDAAALAYLPLSLLPLTGMSRDALLRDWCQQQPCVLSTLDTAWGRIAVMCLPCFDEDLYRRAHALPAMTIDALVLAGRIGAQIVSLTGLLPSATDYGRTITAALADRRDLSCPVPRISTGHATTTAAVVLAIEKLLQAGGRHLPAERVGFLGLGSIGLTSLYLMLRALPHPAEIILCDVYAKRQSLEAIQQTVRDEFGFQGDLRITPSDAQVPRAFYEATLIVGATNVPGILNINRVQPGTLLVDDSAPHCFSPEDAMQRVQQHGDVLLTEGGALRAPQPIHERRYLPRSAEQTMSAPQLDALFRRLNPFNVMGCTLSGLLSARFTQLQPTVGWVDYRTSYQHYAMLRHLGVQAASLHCDHAVLEASTQRRFQRRFGRPQESNARIS